MPFEKVSCVFKVGREGGREGSRGYDLGTLPCDRSTGRMAKVVESSGLPSFIFASSLPASLPSAFDASIQCPFPLLTVLLDDILVSVFPRLFFLSVFPRPFSVRLSSAVLPSCLPISHSDAVAIHTHVCFSAIFLSERKAIRKLTVSLPYSFLLSAFWFLRRFASPGRTRGHETAGKREGGRVEGEGKGALPLPNGAGVGTRSGI